MFVTRFKYFQALIDSIGGIDVNNPVAFSDTYLKPEGFPRASSTWAPTTRWRSPGSATT